MRLLFCVLFLCFAVSQLSYSQDVKKPMYDGNCGWAITKDIATKLILRFLSLKELIVLSFTTNEPKNFG